MVPESIHRQVVLHLGYKPTDCNLYTETVRAVKHKTNAPLGVCTHSNTIQTPLPHTNNCTQLRTHVQQQHSLLVLRQLFANKLHGALISQFGKPLVRLGRKKVGQESCDGSRRSTSTRQCSIS